MLLQARLWVSLMLIRIINPTDRRVQEYFQRNMANSIASLIMNEYVSKVPLFRVWDSLSNHAYMSHGTWLSTHAYKVAIDSVLN